MATIQSATLRLWIYNGEFGAGKTLTPTYTLSKDKLASENSIAFDIAELVKDYIEIRFTGDYDTIQQSAWVEYELTRTFDDGNSDVIYNNYLAYNGYGDFEEGANPELDYTLLQSNKTVYVPEGVAARLPVSRDETGVYKVEYYAGGTLLGSDELGLDVTAVTIDTEDIRVDSIDYTTDMSFVTNITDDSTAQVVTYEGSEIVKILGADGTTTEVKIIYVCEPKFEPYKVTFLNKFGVLQDLYFFKKRTDNLNVTKESYKRNTIDIGTDGVSYSRYKSTKELYNINSDRSFTMNTGFVVEEFNEVIRQLLMTENAWITENDEVYPIVPKTSSLDYKTQLNDKLINFTVEFDYAYNDINNIH